MERGPFGEVEVAELPREEIPAAVDLLARGMRDNPLHLAAFGDHPERRAKHLRRLFGALFEVMTDQRPLAARRDGELVAVTGVAPPGTCRPGARQRVKLLRRLATLGGSAGTVSRWLRTWASRDPDEPHSHLGPLAVDAHLQGRGIGTGLLAAYCRRLDEAGEIGYLETDREENVRLYERHGFEVVGEEPVIGVPNWFMRRGVR